jgi:hypothetical protein
MSVRLASSAILALPPLTTDCRSLADWRTAWATFWTGENKRPARWPVPATTGVPVPATTGCGVDGPTLYAARAFGCGNGPILYILLCVTLVDTGVWLFVRSRTAFLPCAAM